MFVQKPRQIIHQKKDKNKDILILNKLDFFMLFDYVIISHFCESFISKYESSIEYVHIIHQKKEKIERNLKIKKSNFLGHF